MKICIRLLCGHERGGWINPALFATLDSNLRRFSTRGHGVDMGLLADYSPVEYARNKAAFDALEMHTDWLLMIDNDQVLPDDLVQMIEQADSKPEVNVVSIATWMMRRGQANPVPIVNSWEKRSGDGSWVDRPLLPAVSGFQEIQNGAAGVILIRRSVLVRIDAPWFRVLLDKRTCEPRCGEDDYFCARVREAGFKIHTHSGYTCGHLKTVDLRGFAEHVYNGPP
jgi:GT2 family glycosyltransferase